MKKPTVFVEIVGGTPGKESPVAKAFKAVIFDAESVEQLVSGDVEADIAVTNSTKSAFRMIKETERTSIILVFFGKQEREMATALASRYLSRVNAMPYCGSGEGQMDVVPCLLKLISEKSKEE